jgi:hypothetical protein
MPVFGFGLGFYLKERHTASHMRISHWGYVHYNARYVTLPETDNAH